MHSAVSWNWHSVHQNVEQMPGAVDLFPTLPHWAIMGNFWKKHKYYPFRRILHESQAYLHIFFALKEDLKTLVVASTDEWTSTKRKTVQWTITKGYFSLQVEDK